MLPTSFIQGIHKWEDPGRQRRLFITGAVEEVMSEI